MKLTNVQVSYDAAGVPTPSTPLHFELERCSRDFFTDTGFEERFYSAHLEKTFAYCAQHPDLYLSGIKDSALLKQRHAYLQYEVTRCTEEARKKVDPNCKGRNCKSLDPPCAGRKELDRWLATKHL